MFGQAPRPDALKLVAQQQRQIATWKTYPDPDGKWLHSINALREAIHLATGWTDINQIDGL